MRGFDPRIRWYLVCVARKKDHRALRMPERDIFAPVTQFDQKDIVDVELEVIGGDTMAIRPKAEIGTGEYLLAFAVMPGQTQMLFGYGFGVSGP